MGRNQSCCSGAWTLSLETKIDLLVAELCCSHRPGTVAMVHMGAGHSGEAILGAPPTHTHASTPRCCSLFNSIIKVPLLSRYPKPCLQAVGMQGLT